MKKARLVNNENKDLTIIDVNTGEKIPNNSNVYVDENNNIINADYYNGILDNNGDIKVIKPLPEVSVDNLQEYTIPVQGSFKKIKAPSFIEAIQNIKTTDPSENILNDLMFAGPANKAISGTSKLLWNGAKKAILNPKRTAYEIIGGTLGGKTVDNISNKITGKTWSENVQDITGVDKSLAEATNPGYLYGGIKGNLIYDKKLLSKFLKGDEELAWSPLFKGKPTMLSAVNRVLPFLSNVEKTPFRIAAYQIGKRTKGNASVGIKDIIENESSYVGSSTPSGGRNLLALYLFKNDPLVNKTPWFKNILKSFTPAKGGFQFPKRYSELYPGIENNRFEMNTAIPKNTSIRFNSAQELSEYAPIGKIQGKEGTIVIDTADGYVVPPTPNYNPVGPIDDVGGHVIKLDYDKKGRLYQITQDLWKFNPKDYSSRWGTTNKQAALMNKVGTPFILQTVNPVKIGKSRIWKSPDIIPEYVLKGRTPKVQGSFVTLQQGGRFTFKESFLVKNAKDKRDKRKKVIKSDRPTYSKMIIKNKEGNVINYITYESHPQYLEPLVEELSYSNDLFNPYNFNLENDYIIKDNLEKDKIEEDKIEESEELQEPVKTKWMAKDKYDYITTMGKALSKALENNGLDSSVWTKYLLAQTALESNWGKSSLAYKNNNYGGIKGKGVSLNTKEYSKDRGYYDSKSSFRMYSSIDDFADHYVKLLKNKFNAFENPSKYLYNIKSKGYFTAPLSDYSKTFNSILSNIDTLSNPKNIEQVFKNAGLRVRITSGYRPGSVTSNGSTSWHSKKDSAGNSMAYDIVPIDGDFNKLRQAMVNSPIIRDYFNRMGFGVLDETTSEMMARTGATGKHFHIGPDRVALNTWRDWLNY